MKNKEKIWKNIKFIIIAFLLSLFACQRYLNNMMIYTHDLGYHLNRIMQISTGLKNGVFPILIHSGLLHNLGYANPLFYPELFLYIPAIIMNVLSLHVLTAYKLFLIIITFFTFLSMYYVTKKIFGKKEIAYLSSFLYIFSLYRITDIYVRGALGELLAFIFVPLLIYGLYNVIFEDSKKWYLICFGFWGLINSHILTFAIVIPVIILICLFNIDIIFKNKKIFVKLLIAAILSVLLCIGFVGPMLEQKSVGKYKVDDHDVDTSEALLERANSLSMTFSSSVKSGYAVDSSVRDDGLSSGIGGILIVLAALVFLRKNINYKENRFEIQGLIIGFLMLIMTTKIFPWKHLPFLTIVQFPYRLNLFPTLFFALIGAKNYYELFENKKDACIILGLLIVILSGITLSNITLNFNPAIYQTFEDLIDINKGVDREVGNGEYLPDSVDKTNLDLELYNINDREHKIEFTRNNSTVEFEYNLNENDFELNVPLIYYKGYVASIKDNNGNTTKLEVLQNKENGEVLIKSDKNLSGIVTVEYKMTIIQKISYIISIISFIIIVYIFVKETKNRVA